MKNKSQLMSLTSNKQSVATREESDKPIVITLLPHIQKLLESGKLPVWHEVQPGSLEEKATISFETGSGSEYLKDYNSILQQR